MSVWIVLAFLTAGTKTLQPEGTSLIRALHSDDIPLMEKLLRSGTPPDEEEVDGYTALMHAVKRGDEVGLHLAHMLLEFGADPMRAFPIAQEHRQHEQARVLRVYIGDSALRKMAEEKEAKAGRWEL